MSQGWGLEPKVSVEKTRSEEAIPQLRRGILQIEPVTLIYPYHARPM